MVDTGDFLDFFLPAEAVCVELWQNSARFVFSVACGVVKIKGFRIAEPRRGTHDRDGHWKTDDATKDESRLVDRETKSGVGADELAIGEALLPCDAPSGEENRVDRDDVVVLGVKGHHEGEEEEIGV